MYQYRKFIFLAALLAACNPSQDEAKKKLASMKIAQTPETLLASTKLPDSDGAAKLLIAAGVDVNSRQANGMTALMSASFNRQLETARVLLDKGAIVDAEAHGFSALSMAAEHGDMEMAKLLLEHGADPVARPAGGLSALEKAQQHHDSAMIELLQTKK